MRIAMFSETWFPARDGVVTSLMASRRGLEALGHDVFIFAAGSREAAAANKDPHVRILPGMPWRKYPDYHIVFLPGPTRRLLRELKVDVVHVHGPATMSVKAVRAARFERLPLVFTYHTRVEEALGYLTKNPRLQRRIQGLVRGWHAWYFRQCDAVVVPTTWVKDNLIDTTGTDADKLKVVPTGVDVEHFARGDGQAARKKYGLETAKIVLTVGRVAQEKSLETVIDAAEAILRERDDVTFAVAGKGPALAAFKGDVDRRGFSERFRFLGFVPDEDLPSLYHAADAFVMASTFETQGIALLEAMAAGLPVAAADTGGPTDFIEADWNGFLFPGKNAAACADAVRKALAAGPDVRKRARETAGQYSIELQGKALAKVYEEAKRAYAGPVNSP